MKILGGKLVSNLFTSNSGYLISTSEKVGLLDWFRWDIKLYRQTERVFGYWNGLHSIIFPPYSSLRMFNILVQQALLIERDQLSNYVLCLNCHNTSTHFLKSHAKNNKVEKPGEKEERLNGMLEVRVASLQDLEEEHLLG